MQPMQTLRFAPEAIARRYPVPVTAEVTWRRNEAGFFADVPLPALRADDLILPSIAFDSLAYGHHIGLCEAERITMLAPIGMDAAEVPAADGPVKSHLDYFTVDADVPVSQLRILVTGESQAPSRYLITVSIRPRSIVPCTGTLESRRTAVPPLSQLTAPRAIRHRICSPTCVAMVASFLGAPATLASTVEDCLHAPTGIYGVWPLALRAASRWGLLGSVEAFGSIDSAVPFLDRGIPVIASIRFEAGGLPGAPLERTAGHLVVVTGIDRTEVHVNDPAGSGPTGVVQSYPRDAFANAWLRERGATYLFCEPAR